MEGRPHPLPLRSTSTAGQAILEPRVAKPQELVEYFEANYGSFLEGLLADHGAPQASPMCGTTLKSFTAARPPELHFEGYRPSSRRTRRDEGPGRVSVSQMETPRGREAQSRATIPRLTVALPTPRKGKESEDDEERRREACESLRTLVLGPQSVEHFEKEKEPAREPIYRRGSEEEVETFCQCWCQMDVDTDGTVDLDEFASFFSKRKVDRLLGMRCVRYLIPRGATTKASVTKDEMMYLMWPHAAKEDLEQMCGIFDLWRLRFTQVAPPRKLPRKRKAELVKCFQDMDRKKLGTVPFGDLIPAGVAEENMVKVLREKYDKDSLGSFDQNTFLEMMAPMGYWAHDSMRLVVCKDGKKVRFVRWSKDNLHFEGWLTDQHYEKLKDHYGFD